MLNGINDQQSKASQNQGVRWKLKKKNMICFPWEGNSEGKIKESKISKMQKCEIVISKNRIIHKTKSSKCRKCEIVKSKNRIILKLFFYNYKFSLKFICMNYKWKQ